MPSRIPPVLTELCVLATLVLLGLGVRALLHSRRSPLDFLLLLAGSVPLVLWFGWQGQRAAILVVGSAALAVAALLIMRDILRDTRDAMPRLRRWLLASPFALAGLVAAPYRLLRPALFGELGISPPGFLIWLVLSLAITLSLLGLVFTRLVRRIVALSQTDHLTGVMNRRALRRSLLEHKALCRRGQPFSVAVLDVDHFKRINDQHGHAAGDAALQHIVRQLGLRCRGVDSIGRLGGEEFCVLMPGARLAEAVEVAQRLRAQLDDSPWVWQGQRLAVTASFGVAQGTAAGSHEAVLAAADRALYQAKARGRNQVCAAVSDAAKPLPPSAESAPC